MELREVFQNKSVVWLDEGIQLAFEISDHLPIIIYKKSSSFNIFAKWRIYDFSELNFPLTEIEYLFNKIYKTKEKSFRRMSGDSLLIKARTDQYRDTALKMLRLLLEANDRVEKLLRDQQSKES